MPAGPPQLDRPPDGDGPWRLVVESVGSPRDGKQTATLATTGDGPAFRVAATLPRYPVVIPGDEIAVEGSIRERPDSPYGLYLERIGAVGTLTSRTLEIEPAPDDFGSAARGSAAQRRRGADPRPARARGRPRRGHPHRPSRPRRPRPRCRVHDGRRQPRRGDLRLEHRDRRGCHRRDGRPSRAPASVGRHDRRDRRVRGVRRGIGVGRAGGADGRCRAARARDRPRGSRRGRPRVGRDPSAHHGSEPHRRRRLPALVAGDGRTDRLGDATHRLDRVDRARPAPPLAGREPRRVDGGTGGDAADHPRVVRSPGDPVADREPARRPAGRPGDGGRHPRAGGRPGARRRGAVDPGRCRRGTRLGDPADPRADRADDGRPAVRERDVGAAVRRRRGGSRDRRSRGGHLVAPQAAAPGRVGGPSRTVRAGIRHVAESARHDPGHRSPRTPCRRSRR